MSYLIINKGAMEVYERETLDEVAEIVRDFKTKEEVIGEISWSVKRTGRWDREDCVIVVIETESGNE